MIWNCVCLFVFWFQGWKLACLSADWSFVSCRTILLVGSGAPLLAEESTCDSHVSMSSGRMEARRGKHMWAWAVVATGCLALWPLPAVRCFSGFCDWVTQFGWARSGRKLCLNILCTLVWAVASLVSAWGFCNVLPKGFHLVCVWKCCTCCQSSYFLHSNLLFKS